MVAYPTISSREHESITAVFSSSAVSPKATQNACAFSPTTTVEIFKPGMGDHVGSIPYVHALVVSVMRTKSPVAKAMSITLRHL